MLIRRSTKLAETARKNRLEIVKAQLSRRDLFKMGLLTGGGYLVAKHGLSSRATAQSGLPPGPPTSAFVQPLPQPPIQQALPVTALGPAPTVAPNFIANEGRRRPHQALTQFPPQKYYAITQKAGQVSMSPDLPLQNLWGYAIGTPQMNNPITVPGPMYVQQYYEPILVRNFNRLPLLGQNGGFGLPSVSTHLHNGHTPSESDGFPGDFFGRGQFYDQHYPNICGGVNSTHPDGHGDSNESMGSLWYHDHRVDFTAQNVYKGLAGMYVLFNEHDTGDEGTGFRLPSFPDYDRYIMFNDKVVDPATGLIAFDLFNLDGIIGDKYLANGVCQPYLEVSPRRYRLRLLNGGPSRFYEFHIVDPDEPNKTIPFWQISSDGNLLPRPLEMDNITLAVAERVDIIVDFSQFPSGKKLYLQNRLPMLDGRGPTNDLPSPDTNIMEFRVTGPVVADGSLHPDDMVFYDLPDTSEAPRVVRTFTFGRTNGQWMINGRFFNKDQARFRVKKDSVEHWVLRNDSGGWQHPIHIHFEEHQVLSQSHGSRPPGRKDVLRLQFNQEVRLFFRFRDFVGRYPLHCHNTVHEDHAMMLRWDIDGEGDLRAIP